MKLKDKIRNWISNFIGLPGLLNDYENLKQGNRELRRAYDFLIKEYKHDKSLINKIISEYKYVQYKDISSEIKTFILYELELKFHYNRLYDLSSRLTYKDRFAGYDNECLGRILERIDKIKETKGDEQ